jgi:two-component system, chemotaxis family, protein-glutamate methylesterase/glutaminase
MSMTSSTGPVKVLVVDDSVLMQKLMTQIINATPRRAGTRSRNCGPTS